MSDHAAAAGPQRTWRTAENRLFCLARKTVGRGKKLGPAVAAKGSRRSRPAIRPDVIERPYAMPDVSTE
jgi:hypothetical protein